MLTPPLPVLSAWLSIDWRAKEVGGEGGTADRGAGRGAGRGGEAKVGAGRTDAR